MTRQDTMAKSGRERRLMTREARSVLPFVGCHSTATTAWPIAMQCPSDLQPGSHVPTDKQTHCRGRSGHVAEPPSAGTCSLRLQRRNYIPQLPSPELLRSEDVFGCWAASSRFRVYGLYTSGQTKICLRLTCPSNGVWQVRNAS